MGRLRRLTSPWQSTTCSVRSACRAPVGKDHGAAVKTGRAGEFEAAGRPGAVEQVASRAGADEDWVHPQAQLVEQSRGHECVGQGAKAVLHNVGAGLLLEVTDGCDRVMVNDGRV